jgi:hypothetical protein
MYRFRREGDAIKHRARMEFNKVTPFMEDFKWRAVNWQYKFYMSKKSEEAILSSQKEIERIQFKKDLEICGDSRKGLNETEIEDKSVNPFFHPNKTRFFTWNTKFVPNMVPNKISTNPFCPQSQNKTGWIHAKSRKIPDPLPRGKHFVSGTDDSVPIMPKYQ